MLDRKRLLGIDLWRGIAAYAVILVHSGDETWGIPIEQSAIQFRLFFYFAVPFFLATSFFLMVAKPQINLGTKFWKTKIKRMLIPYLLWTIFYITLKLIIFPVTDQTEHLKSILQDPLAILFFGGASYHLYFLPLLFTGSLLLYLARLLKNKQINSLNLGLLTVLSIFVYQLLLWTNNSFILGENVAFVTTLEQLPSEGVIYSFMRTILVIAAWSIRCLPYLLIAVTIDHLLEKHQSSFKFNSQAMLVFWGSCFLLTNTVGKAIVPEAFWEVKLAYSLLFFAIALSSKIKFNPLLINLSKCSFGIYLIHPLIKSGIEIVTENLFVSLTQQVSITSMLFYSLTTFFCSWMIVSTLMKNKLLARYLFGV